MPCCCEAGSRAGRSGAAVAGVSHSRPRAQTYPSQNVTVIVAFPAGGLADIIGRLVSTKLADRLKQSVVVENRGGAGGNIAAKAVAGAAPDGYTLLATTSGLAANLTASKNRGFEQSDLRPVAFVAFSPDVIAVHPSNPAKDLKEFIANAKEKSFTYGSAGAGTGPQIGAEYFFKEVAKVKYVHVPFQGGAPAITALLGNHVDSLVLTLPPIDAAHPQRRAARPRRRQRQAQCRDSRRADLRRDGLSQRDSARGSASSRRPRRRTRSWRSSTPRSTR